MGVPIQLFDLEVPFVWQIPGLLSPSACDALLARAEPGPWLAGTVNGRGGRVVRPEIRDADVAVWRDRDLAQELCALVRPHLPEQMRGGRCVGLSPTIRIYRYRPGQFFGLHRDQKYRRDGHISHLALLVYLDDACEGGATRFPEVDLEVTPEQGRAVVFQNATLHAGQAVETGTKHLLRADVMYVDVDAEHEA